MRAIALEVILRAVIGVTDPRRLARLRELLPHLLEFSVLDMWLVWMYPKLIDSPIGRRHRSQRVRPEVDRLRFAEISEHRSDPHGRDDILAMLIGACDERGEPLGDEALRDQIITLLLAGTRRRPPGSRGASSGWCAIRRCSHACRTSCEVERATRELKRATRISMPSSTRPCAFDR